MRKSLYRGKSPDTLEWYYGNLLTPGEGVDTLPVIRVPETGRYYQVTSESVGEYAGVQVRENEGQADAYEGDIVSSDHWNPDTYVIAFVEGEFCLKNGDTFVPIHYIGDFMKIGNQTDHGGI